MRGLAAVIKSVFVDEAARLLGVSRRTVYNRIQQGKLRTVKTLGGSQRIVVESISALLREEDDGVERPMMPGPPEGIT